MNYYDELFLLCGYEPEELEDDRPRIETVLKKLDLGPEDMVNAIAYVNKNHEVSLLGLRKILSGWLKELIDLVLAKEEGKKIVYFELPAIFGPQWILKASSDNVYAVTPDMIFGATMGQIFNKEAPIFEAGEVNGMPPGHGLCTLWTHKAGALAKGLYPVPDIVLASSYMCDMGSKGCDYLTELYGVPIAYVDNCPDYEWGKYPDFTPETIKYFGGEIDRALKLIEDTIGVQIQEDGLECSMGIIGEFLGLFAELGQLIAADPQPFSSATLNLIGGMIVGSTGRCVKAGMEGMKILIEEVRQRVEAGIGVVEKGAPKVILFIYSGSDPGLARMMEEYVAIPASFVAFYPIVQPPGVVLDMNQYKTVGEKIAAMELVNGMFHSGYSQVKKFELIVNSLRDKVDGVIWTIIYHCRPASITSHTMKTFMEENTDLPVLTLELDLFDSRYYNAETMRTKIETFAEMLKQRKMREKTRAVDNA